MPTKLLSKSEFATKYLRGEFPEIEMAVSHEKTNEGLTESGNVDLRAQPVVKNPNGSTSTVDSSSYGFDGRETLLPSVTPDGRHLTGEAVVDEYKKTGRHLGKFDTPEHATKYASRLHDEYERGDYNKPGLGMKALDLGMKAISPIPQVQKAALKAGNLVEGVERPDMPEKGMFDLPEALRAVPDVVRGFLKHPIATGRGLVGGMVEGAGDIVSPSDVAMGAAPMLKGGGKLAKAAKEAKAAMAEEKNFADLSKFFAEEGEKLAHPAKGIEKAVQPSMFVRTAKVKKEEAKLPSLLQAVKDAGLPVYSKPPRSFEEAVKRFPKSEQLHGLYKKGSGLENFYDELQPTLAKYVGPENVDKFIGYIAATSPANQLRGNIKFAVRAFEQDQAGKPFSGFMKAHLMNLERAKKGEGLSGPKVKQFLQDLLGKVEGDEGATVDRWMLGIYGQDPAHGPSKSMYNAIQSDIAARAKEAGVSTKQYQAGLWAGARRKRETIQSILEDEFGQRHMFTDKLLPKAEDIQAGVAKLNRLSPQEAAELYTSRKGMPKPIPHPPVKVDENFAKRVADVYDEMPHMPDDPKVKSAYDALKRETSEQFAVMTKEAGVKAEPWTKPGQPYANSQEMMKDVTENGHLYYFPTEQGFGTGEKLTHPMLEKGASGLPANDELRAVHDYFAHAKGGHSFGPQGEENAFIEHAKLYSPEAVQALASETRGQNSWVNFGKHLRDTEGKVPKKGESGYIPQPNRPFAPQKANVMPPEMQEAFLELEHRTPHTNLTEADPGFYGTGKAGEELKRSKVEGFIPRTYYTVKGGRVEDVFKGLPVYDAKAVKALVYDLGQDPLSLIEKAQKLGGMDPMRVRNTFEQLVKESGFLGYRSDETVALFEKLPLTKRPQ